MEELYLDGLDGTNPLAFFAALGVLSSLQGGDPSSAGVMARLLWREEDTWRPVICTPAPIERSHLIERLRADVVSWRDEPCRQLRYIKKGGDKEAWDLKPPPDVFRAYLSRLVADANPTHRRSVDFAACFATDVAEDNNGNVKPTSFHFTAGQQEFLAMVDTLISLIEPSELEEAVFGPWSYSSQLPVMRWDATANRDYALRASNPSNEKKSGVPGADWLAFRGISNFPVVARGSRLVTACCRGGWKNTVFQWPLWSVPLSSRGVRTVLTLDSLSSMSSSQRSARGIGAIFESSIHRSDQGGYGSFSPPRVC